MDTRDFIQSNLMNLCGCQVGRGALMCGIGIPGNTIRQLVDANAGTSLGQVFVTNEVTQLAIGRHQAISNQAAIFRSQAFLVGR